MKALVIGYGSIGARHASVLEGLGVACSVVSARRLPEFARPLYASPEEALACDKFDYVIISSPTAAHYAEFQKLAASGYSGYLLVEKPVFALCPQLLPEHGFSGCWVGYNFRFHPLLQRLRDELKTQKILSATIHTGQYLPLWRPGTDYRRCYSASSEDGGGVLRDLSHELDYCNWLFGPWKRLAALGGRLSSLEITSEDHASILLETSLCHSVTISLDYLDRISSRTITVNTDDHTYRLDLLKGALLVDGELEAVPVDRNLTYKLQHQAVINRQFENLCTLDEGLSVVRMIEAVEKSISDRCWVCQ